jgi:hypothetical protein
MMSPICGGRRLRQAWQGRKLSSPPSTLRSDAQRDSNSILFAQTEEARGIYRLTIANRKWEAIASLVRRQSVLPEAFPIKPSDYPGVFVRGSNAIRGAAGFLRL